MSEYHGVECDQCKKRSEANQEGEVDTEGWYLLSQASVDEATQMGTIKNVHLCSLKCLRAHARMRNG